ncbi:MAG TPA: TonB-dependent receptor [Bryobacteraceae bacterium]|nr:TonB-dependent receptor [Bryobacteraceae bacterium]
MKLSIAPAVLVLVLAVTPAGSQDYQATLQGLVKDQAGRAIEGAVVTIADVDRNVRTEIITNSIGRFVARYLPPGAYRLTIEKAGFQPAVRAGIRLAASDRVEYDATLVVGPPYESITVTGALPTIDTESASRTTVLGSRILDSVPSGGRNAYALEYGVASVIKTTTYWGAMELYAIGNVDNVQIGGGRSGENETLIEGLPDTRSNRNVEYVPPLASIDEFTLHTNAYDAQFGRTGGGITSITLKSGTNQFHGQLYEFLKNDKLRANDWIANKNGEPNTPFKNSTFGFEVAGPAIVPKVFNGRNRAFFLLSFEGLREHSAGGQVRTLPSEAMKSGNFSQLLNDSGQPVQIYDPMTASLQPDGQYARVPFVGNQIPATRIDPVAAKVLQFYPQANLPGDGPAHSNNYSKVLPSINSYDAWLGKIDLYSSNRSRLTVRYGQTPWQDLANLVWGNNAAEPSTHYPSTEVERNGGMDWTLTVSPALILDLRAGISRYEALNGNSFGAGFDPAGLGFPGSLVSQFTALQFPRFSLGTYSELGVDGSAGYEAHDTSTFSTSAIWMRGRHVLRGGLELRRYDDNFRQPGTASGIYTFSKAWTQANPLRGDANSGDEFASFLLGLPASGSVPLNIDPSFRSGYYALFFGDDFKATSRLSISYGLRWDYETPYVERYNRMVSGFAFGQPSPIASQVQGLTLQGGLLFARQNGSSRYAFDPKPLNFQPRIGLVYHPANNWVIRGGYGIVNLGQSSSGTQSGFSATTNMITSLDGNITPAASLSDPFPTALFPNGLFRPIGSSKGLATNLGQGVSASWRDRPLPYSQQYSFGIERALPRSWLLDIAYQGNLTRRLPVTLGLNFIPSSVLQSVPVEQRAAYFSALVPNPMAGLLPGTALNTTTIPRQQLTYAFPQYSQVNVTDVPIGKQRYDSLQLELKHRFSAGIALSAAYTVSKTLEQISILNPQDIDTANPLATHLEQRLAAFDVPQQLSVVGSYDLPFGKGRHFLRGGNRWANAIVGGWTFSGFFMSHSGFPLAFPNAAPLEARSAALTDAQRDALARQAGRSQFDVSYDKWYDVTLFPRVAGPAPFTLRNFPTRFPDVRGKPLHIADISFYKEFHPFESVRLQVRADAHNVGNFPWFASALSSTVTDSGFGQLKADMGNEVRVVVCVLKVVF